MNEEKQREAANVIQMCFECIETKIKSDLSPSPPPSKEEEEENESKNPVFFCYALSNSPLPFSSSSAVVQIQNSEILGVEADSSSSTASQFIVSMLPLHSNHCFSRFVDEFLVQTMEDCENPNASPGSVAAVETTFGCPHSNRLSCVRTVTALAPLAVVDNSSHSSFKLLASDFLSGCLEDHVLGSLTRLIEGKASPFDAVNFLRMIGTPSFDENHLPGCLRHPNIVPVLAFLKASDCVYTVTPKAPYTLESILHYSPSSIKSEWHIRFFLYQLLSSVAYIHGLGVSHGNICPGSVMVTELFWSWLHICDRPMLGSNLSPISHMSARTKYCAGNCSSQGLYADLQLSTPLDWHSQFELWWKGELSNFEYLLVLNRLAGRRWGDHMFHPVMPWVIDFSVKPDVNSNLGWRDLSKSKWRLAKGDEQLDFTYSTSEIPHHVSDECLSDLAVCSYKARRLPLSILRQAVRSVYEPNEYPSTMQRLYQWTPDECIPEFYCDPRIFYSLHAGMSDLAVPSWAGSPEEFIKLHRDALESEWVSRNLHHWIDITFGYKMSGQAAIAAKNVMLPSSQPTMLRSVGRRQLFYHPHPARQVPSGKKHGSTNESATDQCRLHGVESDTTLLAQTAYLQKLEASSVFSEHAGHLSPQYHIGVGNKENISNVSENDDCQKNISKPLEVRENHGSPFDINLSNLIDLISVDAEGSTGYQELLLWQQRSSRSGSFCEDFADDIFSVGCILAELCLKKPLFNSTSLAAYSDSGTLPGSIQQLPADTRLVVEACIQKDWTRRPSAKSILESAYFPASVKSSYLFVAPLQLLANNGSRLCYAAKFAQKGALRAMGAFAAEMCAPCCLPLVVSPLTDTEAEWAYVLLKELIKCLAAKAVKTLVLPAIQKILQTVGDSHLKVSLLQGSFVQDIWNLIGEQAYLEAIHPLVISNLHIAPHKSSAAVASVLLIGTSEELGVPVTVNQTILPLIHCFGKGLCTDGIDVLVRIGGLFGTNFIAKQMLPLLKQVVHSCINASNVKKPEPVQSWSASALIDCLTTLDGLVVVLPKDVIVKELIQDRSCLHVMVLMQVNFEPPVLQVAGSTLLAVCQKIGPELTALHVLPQLKELFDEIAFSQETANSSGSSDRYFKISKSKFDGETQVERRMDLVLLLYPSLASLLGIEKLRQCCATWLLLEQFLLRCHNWKWEYALECSRSGAECVSGKRHSFNKVSASDHNPAKLLLNGVGWSVPQSQGSTSSKNLMSPKQLDGVRQKPAVIHTVAPNYVNHEPWFWFPSPAASWDGPDFIGRVGTLKDEVPWKIRASVVYSIRAHHGVLRSLAVSQDECAVFTAGTGPGFKGTVQKWDLSRINCVSGYYGHEEVVNDICVLSSSGRIASCDGTVHVWKSRTGKAEAVFSEPSVDSGHLSNSSSSASKFNIDHQSLLNSSTLSNELLTSAFDGSLYTCMHQLSNETLVVGTGNGSLRFIDISQGQKLHLWRGEPLESTFPSLVSALCSCGSDKIQAYGTSASPSWIAAGLSSGHCKLFDSRSGNVVASWRAHDGYVTQLAAPEDYLLVSSSFDRTLRIWDLRRKLPPEAIVFKGHKEGISGFAIWGQDVISISKNRIGLSSLSRSAEEDWQQRIVPQKLYVADHGMPNFSVLTSISILPFSRLFVVGTEDGYLRICH